MTPADSTSSVLNNAALKRAWLGAPLAMTGWLVLIAYIVAFFIAAQMGNGHAGWYFGYQIGWLTPLWWGLGISFVGFVFGAIGMSIAEERTQKALGFTFLEDTHTLTRRVHRMAATLDLPAPRVGIMRAVNAFAVGTTRHDASVILGVPLINNLNPDELDAVIGHELGHIASGDMRRTLFAEGYQNLFGFVAAGIGFVVAILLQQAVKTGHMTGSGAGLVHHLGNFGRMTLGAGSEFFVKSSSRNREFYADAVGAAMSSPAAMSRALQRLGDLTENSSPAESRYAYLMIKGFSGGAFSTHPSTDDRVAALRSEEYLGRMRAAHTRRQQLRVQARAATRQAGAGFMFGAGKVVELAVLGVQHALAAIARRKGGQSSMAPTPTAGDAGPGRIEPRF